MHAARCRAIWGHLIRQGVEPVEKHRLCTAGFPVSTKAGDIMAGSAAGRGTHAVQQQSQEWYHPGFRQAAPQVKASLKGAGQGASCPHAFEGTL